MRPVVWYRMAALLMLLFAAGHMFGFLAFQPPTAEGRAVWTAMNNVRFPVGKSVFSYGEFYVGFGLFISVFQLFTAWLAWFMGSLAKRGVQDARVIAWAMFALQVIAVGLSLRYFAAPPAVLSSATAICLGIGALSTRPKAIAAG